MIDDSYNNLAMNKKNDEEMDEIGEVEDVKCDTQKRTLDNQECAIIAAKIKWKKAGIM